MSEIKTFETTIGGRTLTFETGRLAQQAGASLTLRYGDTQVLCTVCTSKKPREGVDFLPLTIDYEERSYAAGKIPGGFIRREGRPSEHAILACRLTDRPLRPLLPKNWRREIQVITTVQSVDLENDANLLSIIGGSAGLSMSEIPFAGPVGAVRIGCVDDELIINPTLTQMAESSLELIVVSTAKAVVMVECGANEVSEELIFRALRHGHEVNQEIIKTQLELQAACGQPKVDAPELADVAELEKAMASLVDGKLDTNWGIVDKHQRQQAMDDLEQEVNDKLGEKYESGNISNVFEDLMQAALRGNILGKSQRIGGRKLTEIRALSCDVGLLPRTHGSGLFQRGQTQVLSVTTLGPIRKEQPIDGLGLDESKRFMHHYNFPPYSNGETKRVGSPGRREIGHGALVEKALAPVLPANDEFPYCIRLVSECLSSNGSTSQASICAGTLSMMDAGIPVKRPVAGIAMGLMTDDSGNFKVLTDIEGAEDHYGDMDFKVAGTTEGVTALQLDMKVQGITFDMMEKAVAQAKDARMFILEVMGKTLAQSRPEMSQYAPRMYKISVDPEKIGGLIGPGGRTIRAITEQTGTTIDIENDGTVIIGASDAAGADNAIKIIEGLTKEIEVGTVYTGKVSRVLNFGAMVEILPGKDGLVHISELENYRVNTVEDVVKVGDEIKVKVIEIDSMGRINLSRRALLEGYNPADRPAQPRDSRPPRRDFNRGRPPERRF